MPAYWNTGWFISPSGISDLCSAVAGMVTPKESMSTEGETLQVSVLPYRCSVPPFCCVCLGCCAAEFGGSAGTYELLCTSGLLPHTYVCFISHGHASGCWAALEPSFADNLSWCGNQGSLTKGKVAGASFMDNCNDDAISNLISRQAPFYDFIVPPKEHGIRFVVWCSNLSNAYQGFIKWSHSAEASSKDNVRACAVCTSRTLHQLQRALLDLIFQVVSELHQST
jgi:hypothetical protein